MAGKQPGADRRVGLDDGELVVAWRGGYAQDGAGDA
jgi:hypothetical protein